MTTGEFADAMVRIFLLVGFADQVVQRRGYAAVGRLWARHARTADLAQEDLRQIVREQSRIVQTDADQALATLPRLLPGEEDRREARGMLDQAVASLGRALGPRVGFVLESIKKVLGTQGDRAGC